jgi:hypothetical protein
MDSSDRYGGNWPDPVTVCDGDCEGMGTVPVKRNDEVPYYREEWLVSELLNPSTDGTHFLPCFQCRGSGRRVR